MRPICCRLPPHRQRLGRVPYQGARTAVQEVFYSWLLHVSGPPFLDEHPYCGPSVTNTQCPGNDWAAFCIAGTRTAAQAVVKAGSAVTIGPLSVAAVFFCGPTTAILLRIATAWAAFGACAFRVRPIGLRTQRPRSEMGCSAFHRAPDACKSALPDASGKALATM